MAYAENHTPLIRLDERHHSDAHAMLAKVVIIADDARNAVLLKLWLEG